MTQGLPQRLRPPARWVPDVNLGTRELLRHVVDCQRDLLADTESHAPRNISVSSAPRSVSSTLELAEIGGLSAGWNANGRRRLTRTDSDTVCSSFPPIRVYQQARR